MPETKHVDVDLSVEMWHDLQDWAAYENQSLVSVIRSILGNAIRTEKARMDSHQRIFERAGNGRETGGLRANGRKVP